MSGDIYFGYDKSDAKKWLKNDGYVNTPTFMAFGDLLTAALSKEHAALLEVIKEGEPMAIYDFCGLSTSEYNAVIHALRKHVAGLVSPTPWQQKGAWVWTEMAEPFIYKDERYDFAYHHEALPGSGMMEHGDSIARTQPSKDAGNVVSQSRRDHRLQALVESKEVILQGEDGSVLWRRGAPTSTEWAAKAKPLSASDSLEQGEFRYLQAVTSDAVVVVFAPKNGLDWNVWFDAKTGALLTVTEAR